MAKYSTEFKYKVVERYLEGNESYEFLAKIFNIPDRKLIRVWVNTYQTLGYDGLKRSRKKQKYSTEFKRNVVKLYLTEEWSYQDLANNLGITNPSMICTWVGKYRKYGIEGLEPKKRGRPSIVTNNEDKKASKPKDKEYTKEEQDRIKELEDQVCWLQMEVDFLKKKRELRQRGKLKKKK